MQQNLIVSSDALVDRLFRFCDGARGHRHHRKFFAEMIIGILGSKSTLVSNVARFLNEGCSLQVTENRLCQQLMRILLCEQRGFPAHILAMTEVG